MVGMSPQRNGSGSMDGTNRANRIPRLTRDPALARDAEILYQEIQSLESHLEQFEKQIEM